MSKPEKFYLPEGYKENPVLSTMDSQSGGTYWHARRLSDAYNYQYAVYQYAGHFIKKNGLSSLVDVGCGPGVKLSIIHNKLPNVKVTGIDQPHPIEFCKETHPFGEWFADDFENPSADLKDLHGDLVICADVIEHVLDPDKLLSYLALRVKKDGYVLISTPDRDKQYGEGFMESGHKDHIREWNKEEFAAYLKSRGWDVVEHFHAAGVRGGLNMAYLNAVVYHFLQKRPKSFNNNQVVLAKAP